jgi:hypothetical protein
MRFPNTLKDPETGEVTPILDHRMVFQLADVLNDMNGNEPAYVVKFIQWIQNSANAPVATSKRRPDGTIPGMAEAAANPDLMDNPATAYSNETAVEDAQTEYSKWANDNGLADAIAKNVFRAHKQAIQDGMFDFSEAGYMRYILHLDGNLTDVADMGGSGSTDNAPSWPYENVYFSANDWKTIDKGLSRLPAAFGPLVLNRTRFGVRVQGLSYSEETQKITAHWRPGNPFDVEAASEDFDFVTVAVPFGAVRLWRLPQYPSLLLRAINNLHYDSSCKVALHYRTRFWEHLPKPIFGGCGSIDIPGVGSICYPSYEINSTRPGVLLASYAYGQGAKAVGALSEIDHVALVQRAMIETHGQVAAEQYTGAYDRICWQNSPDQMGAWAGPLVGQQEVYLPAYFQTEKHTVFVGEHTSFTHSWIWSALESAVRGSAQLLLDLGLVDESKAITKQWMARWMNM